MYQANRRFIYQGVRYSRGDEVPLEVVQFIKKESVSIVDKIEGKKLKDRNDVRVGTLKKAKEYKNYKTTMLIKPDRSKRVIEN